jgi:hypothetical protein
MSPLPPGISFIVDSSRRSGEGVAESIVCTYVCGGGVIGSVFVSGVCVCVCVWGSRGD